MKGITYQQSRQLLGGLLIPPFVSTCTTLTSRNCIFCGQQLQVLAVLAGDIASSSRTTASKDLLDRAMNSVSRIPRSIFLKKSQTSSFPTTELVRGTARALFTRTRVAKYDIQDSIAEQYEGDGKIRRENIEPTGTRFVWDLTGEDYWPGEIHLTEQYINGDVEDEVVLPAIMITSPSESAKSVCDNGLGQEHLAHDRETKDNLSAVLDEEDSDDASPVVTAAHLGLLAPDEPSATTPTKSPPNTIQTISLSSDLSPEAARRARLMRSHKSTSLAALIASADDLEEPLEDDASDTSSVLTPLHIDHIINAHNQEITTKKYNALNSLKIPSKSPLSSPASISPDNDTSPEVARTLPLMRSRDGPSLAALIAAADASIFPDEDDYPDTASDHSNEEAPLIQYTYSTTPTSLFWRPCYDPTFPGHSPCDTHQQHPYGRSADAALRVLRRRFEALHDVTGDGAWYREYILQKGETGNQQTMVHGGSALRNEVTHEEEDEYDESVFLYKLYEGDHELLGDDVLVSIYLFTHPSIGPDFPLQHSSSPFDDTIGVYATPPKEHADSSVHYDDHGLGFEVSFLFSLLSHNANRMQEPNSSLENVADDTVHLSTPTPISRMIHIRNASMNDAFSIKSSMRTSVFSKQSSTTTKTSHTSINSGGIEYSQLVDALDLGGDQQHTFRNSSAVSVDGGDRPSTADKVTNGVVMRDQRVGSSSKLRPVSTISARCDAGDDFSVDDFSLLALGTWVAHDAYGRPGTKIADPINHAADDERLSSGAPTIHIALLENVSSNSPFEANRPACFVEHIEDTESEFDYEPFFLAPRTTHKTSRQRQCVEKMKSTAKKISGKAHDLVKSTKHFARTLYGFVPAVITARNPFGGI